MNKFFHIFILIMVCGWATSYKAQDTLTMELALQIAQQNNPGLKAATLFVEKEKALLKSNIVVEKTDFSYSLGQMNSDMVDYSINVSQSFNFPTSGAKKQLLEAKVAAGESNLEIAKSELSRSVRMEFITITNLQQQLEMYQQQETLYRAMLDIATKKMQVGESNVLEKMTAESQFQEVQISRKKIDMDITTHKSNLSLLLYTEIRTVSISEESMLELPLMDSGKISANPILSLYQQTIDIKEKEVIVNKKGFFPDFNVGYFNQQIDGTQGFQGIQVGIAVPLFNRHQKAAVKASKIEVDVASQEMENYRLTMYQLLQQKIQNYNKYYLEIEHYETKGKALAKRLTDAANKAYQEGEIEYIEYIQSIKQAKQIKINYLKSLQNYQSETIEILYLTGQ